MAFDYFDKNLIDFSLSNNFINLHNKNFNLCLVCFVDGCSSDLPPDIDNDQFLYCLDMMVGLNRR